MKERLRPERPYCQWMNPDFGSLLTQFYDVVKKQARRISARPVQTVLLFNVQYQL